MKWRYVSKGEYPSGNETDQLCVVECQYPEKDKKPFFILWKHENPRELDRGMKKKED